MYQMIEIDTSNSEREREEIGKRRQLEIIGKPWSVSLSLHTTAIWDPVVLCCGPVLGTLTASTVSTH